MVDKDKTEETDETGDRFVGEYEIVGHEEITEEEKKLFKKFLRREPGDQTK